MVWNVNGNCQIITTNLQEDIEGNEDHKDYSPESYVSLLLYDNKIRTLLLITILDSFAY